MRANFWGDVRVSGDFGRFLCNEECLVSWCFVTCKHLYSEISFYFFSRGKIKIAVLDFI